MTLESYPRPATIYSQAHQMWPILCGWVCFECQGKAKRKGIITYGELATYMGYSPNAGRTLGRALGLISNFCKENDLPRLNSIVVDYETRLPGDGIPEDFAGSIEDMQEEVFRQNWFDLIPPTRRAIRDSGLG
jgi:hypothetical protein